jgi:hypothetical protein
MGNGRIEAAVWAYFLRRAHPRGHERSLGSGCTASSTSAACSAATSSTRPAISCSAGVIRKRAASQPSLSDCAANLAHMALTAGNSSKRGRPSVGAKATAAPRASRFACLRVRRAHRDEKLAEPRPEEWLLIEWLEGEKEPTRYWLSTSPESIEFAALVDVANLRWRIERDYQELKQESGSDISKAADCAASTTTRRCTSRLMASRSPSGRRSPLRTSSRQTVRRPCRSRRLPILRRRRCGPCATRYLDTPNDNRIAESSSAVRAAD